MEFVIVDDASGDGCCDRLEELLDEASSNARVIVVRLDRWSGIPMARNIGAREARAPILFITDSNVQACRHWDIPVFRELRSQPRRALCATIADKGSSWRGYGCSLDLSSMTIRWLCGPGAVGRFVAVTPCTGTVLHADLFRQLGGYDTAMPIYGAAEPEFSVRLWLYGGDILHCPDLVLTHRFRPSGERQPFLDRIASVQVQNYLRFGLLYLDDPGIRRMLDYWEKNAPQLPVRQLHETAADNARSRRQHLLLNLPHSFRWYTERFRLA
jgi:glycosyltransferase involved in cell wall biosynthesis